MIFVRFIITYAPDPKNFLPVPEGQINAILPENKIVWFGGRDGLMRFRDQMGKKRKSPVDPFIRRVSLNNKKTIYDGFPREPGQNRPLGDLDYRDRNIRFEFAAPSFDTKKGALYSYYLGGYDHQWSAWTEETWKDYTNLDPGDYVFRVRTINIYQEIRTGDHVTFQVLPPWYRTPTSIGVFSFLGLMAIYFLVRWRSLKLQREKKRLEREVKQRTWEIHNKNRQLEEQTVQLTDQARQLTEMAGVKSRFFANISHEFRTPLTLIIGPLEHLLEEPPENEISGEGFREHLEIMLGNSRRLLMLINQLLDLSRLDSGRIQLHPERRDLVVFLKGILAAFDPAMRNHGLNLAFHACQPCFFLCFDPEKLEKIVVNLLSNAVKFTPEGGAITVTIRETEDSSDVEVSVADTCVGIPQQDLEHIFDYFYQAATDSTQSSLKGSGIGLALARELAVLHNGELRVNSRQGKGAEFILRLPRTEIENGEIRQTGDTLKDHPEILELMEPPARAKEGKEKTEKTPDPSQDRPVVLVVEDNTDMRRFIEKSLDSIYTVITAINGGEGVDTAKKIIPDVIVSDIMMPVLDGYQLCKQLKTSLDTCHIPIILLTAKASEESHIHGLETGADDYITKPFNTKILVTRIKNLLDLRRQMQLKIQRKNMLLPHDIPVCPMDEDFLRQLHEVMEKNISDPEFNIDQLCDQTYMGRTSLFKKIQALTGETPGQFIRSFRLQRAAQLLKANFGNITQVAFEVGFTSSAYFTKCFKEKYHRLPSTFLAAEKSTAQH